MSDAKRGRRPRVLVIDDQIDLAETVADGLAAHGFDALAIANAEEAVAHIERGEHDALVTDLRIPGRDGLELLRRSRAVAPESPVIVMTAFSAIDSAIESIRRGAYHYLTKPFKVEELALFLQRGLDEMAVRRERQTLRKSLRSAFALEHIIGTTRAMRDLADLIRRVADATVPVLILGETGTGKGLVARALHAESARAERPFIAINCAALPETLLESELFGHAKGAFTGATAARAGIFEAAHGGTLFLDEIGEMSAALQAKLLHVLETSRVRPLGETREREVDVRIVAATHRDLQARAQSGEFRQDLLYRLDVVSIELPALRFRREDIPALVDHFLTLYRAKHTNALPRRLSPDAMAVLQSYAWPGNVRELEHVIERMLLLGRTEEVQLAELPRTLTGPAAEPGEIDFGRKVLPMREMQRRYVAWAITQCGGQKRAACEALEVDIKTLNRWLGG